MPVRVSVMGLFFALTFVTRHSIQYNPILPVALSFLRGNRKANSFHLAGTPINSLVYTMNEAQLLSLSQDETLTEKLSLRFQKFQMSYQSTTGKSNQSVVAGWDLGANKSA